MYPLAKDAAIRAGLVSASFLQRRLKIGYARAARLLDLLEEDGIIGPADGAKPRQVLIRDMHHNESNTRRFAHFSPSLLKSFDRGFAKSATSPLYFIDFKGLARMTEPREYISSS